MSVVPQAVAEDLQTDAAEGHVDTTAFISLNTMDSAGLQVIPSPCTWGVERRAEFGTLGPLAGCFSALGSGLGLAGTASSRR